MSRLSTKTIETIKCEIKATFSSFLTGVLKKKKLKHSMEQGEVTVK